MLAYRCEVVVMVSCSSALNLRSRRCPKVSPSFSQSKILATCGLNPVGGLSCIAIGELAFAAMKLIVFNSTRGRRFGSG